MLVQLLLDHDSPGVSKISYVHLVAVNQGARASASTVPAILDHFINLKFHLVKCIVDGLLKFFLLWVLFVKIQALLAKKQSLFHF